METESVPILGCTDGLTSTVRSRSICRQSTRSMPSGMVNGLFHWAGKVGSNTQVAVQAILSSYKVEQQGYKSCMGLLKLADKYTPERLENACKRALEYTPRPSLKNIQAILASGQDKAIPEQSTATASSSRYGFTRGAEYYGRGNK